VNKGRTGAGFIEKLIIAVLALCLIISFPDGESADAASKAVIVEAAVGSKQIHLFAKGFTPEDKLTAVIGSTPVKIGGLSTVQKDQKNMKTLVLIDNSYDTTEETKQVFSKFLEDYIADKSTHEDISIYVFGEEASVVVDYSSEYVALIDAVKKMCYGQEKSYVTDVLYDIVDNSAYSDEAGFKRIILLTDGFEDESIGYTRKELDDLIADKPIPIYVMGCKSESNSQELENVFSLSRITGAKSYILNEYDNMLDIAEELKEDESVLRISLVPSPGILDGSVKAVKISNGSSSATIDLRMPQVVSKKDSQENADKDAKDGTENAAESEDKTAVAVQPANGESPQAANAQALAPTQETAAQEESSSWDTLTYVLVFGSIGLFLCIVVIVVILILRKRRDPFGGSFAPDLSDDSTLRVSYAPDTDVEETAKVWNNVPCYVTLKDLSRPEKVFRQIVNGTLTIGRSSSKNLMVIDYDKTISGRHCNIVVKEDGFYITDVGSSNGTFVNDERITKETHISNNDTITLGQAKFAFEGVRRE